MTTKEHATIKYVVTLVCATALVIGLVFAGYGWVSILGFLLLGSLIFGE